MAKRIRTFIAIEIPAALRRRIVALQQKLASAAGGVKWVEMENIHLTLKFLGEVDEREIYTVCKAVQGVGAAQVSFDMTVAGVGAFPNAKRPRVVWAGVTDGAAELIGIRDALDDALEAHGYTREDRSYRPHITLGRFRRGGGSMEEAMDQQQDWQGGQMTAAELVVMASQLTPQGPQYTVLGRGRLG